MAIIIKPLVTEKMTKITEKQNTRFGFVVRPDANKLEIKKEVEAQMECGATDDFKEGVAGFVEKRRANFK